MKNNSWQRSLARIVMRTDFRTKPLGRVRSKVSVSKQKRHAITRDTPQRFLRKLDLQIKTGCLSRAQKTAELIQRNWPLGGRLA